MPHSPVELAEILQACLPVGRDVGENLMAVTVVRPYVRGISLYCEGCAIDSECYPHPKNYDSSA
jgi:hypothetical protein